MNQQSFHFNYTAILSSCSFSRPTQCTDAFRLGILTSLGPEPCPLLAQRVRCRGARECQLSGELRKSLAPTRDGAVDPEPTRQ